MAEHGMAWHGEVCLLGTDHCGDRAAALATRCSAERLVDGDEGRLDATRYITYLGYEIPVGRLLKDHQRPGWMAHDVVV